MKYKVCTLCLTFSIQHNVLDIHLWTNISIPSLNSSFIVLIHHDLLFQSPIYGQWSSFLVIENKTAINICAPGFVWTYVFICSVVSTKEKNCSIIWYGFV